MPRVRASLAVAALMLAGCGGGDDDNQLDTVNYEKAIVKSVLEQHQQVVKVECPPKVAKKKGETFTCDVKLDVGIYPVKVTETDDKGHVTYENKTPLVLLDTAAVEHAIGVEIRHQRHLGSDVTCPKQVLQQKGLTFSCSAKVEDGVTTRFRVDQVDDQGNVNFTGL